MDFSFTKRKKNKLKEFSFHYGLKKKISYFKNLNCFICVMCLSLDIIKITFI